MACITLKRPITQTGCYTQRSFLHEDGKRKREVPEGRAPELPFLTSTHISLSLKSVVEELSMPTVNKGNCDAVWQEL